MSSNIRVRFCMVFTCYLASIVSVSDSQCSCYTFYNNITERDWDASRGDCKAQGGDLVSMETLEEWEFIKAQIRYRSTSSGPDQWFIGLVREDNVWKWLSNHNLTYNKWKAGLELYNNTKSQAFIEKQDGILQNTYWYVDMGSICEENRTDCKPNQVKRCDYLPTTSVTLRDSTAVLTGSGVADSKPTAGHVTTTPMDGNVDANKDEPDSKKKEPFSMVIIIIIVVVCVLLAIIAIIVIVCIRRRKKGQNEDKHQRGQQDQMNKEEQEEFILQPQDGEKLPQDPATA